jgi:hypothetical protein
MLLVPDAQADRAIHVIDASGLAPRLETLLALKPQGRPRQLPLRTYLIGAYLAIECKASFKNTAILEVLTIGLSRAKQHQLQVRTTDPDGRDRVIGKSALDYFSRSLPKRLAYTPQSAQLWGLDVDQDEMDRRREGLEAAMAALLEASLATDGGSWYALDGSGAWSWGRAKYVVNDTDDVRAQETVAEHDRVPDEIVDLPADQTDEADDQDVPSTRRTISNHDPDAAIGSKTSKSGKRESYYGYVIDAAIRVTPPGAPREPVVVERMLISPASTDVVEPTLKMLDSLADTPGGVTDVIVDRHYSYKGVDRWADPLRTRGINQHFDLRADEHGFRDINGMRLAAGWMHCPATPDDLATIPRPGPGSPRATHTEFARLIRERRSWAMDRHTREPSGRTRWVCPAQAGKRGCPLRPGTVEIARQAGLPIVDTPPDSATAPPCCTQDTVSDTSDAMRKHQQPHYWGTEEWKLAYDLRTYVEGLFGSLKNPDTEGVRRGFTKFVGLPMVTLGLTLAAAICNVRHQRRFWADRDDRPDHPLLHPDPEFAGWTLIGEHDVATTERPTTPPDGPAADQDTTAA